MIIEYTLKDNDYTQVIEQYLEEYGPFLAIFFSTIDEHIEFKKDIARYDNLKNNSPEQKELKSKLTKTLKQKFKAYINSIAENSNWNTGAITAKELIDSRPYILKNIKIKIVHSITDKWQNGEVVYYFTSNQKYLTM